MSPTIRDEPPRELPEVLRGRLPERYGAAMQGVLLERLRPLLVPGVSVLDVGAGRAPTLARDDRPPRCRWVGLDISASELDAAQPKAYDDVLVHDITRPLPAVAQWDVAVSWQVLEHVRPLETVLNNLRTALRPGGTLLAQLSGSFAAFALAARVLPHRVRLVAMSRLLGDSAEEKFPTYYDRCYHSALIRMLEPWSYVEIVPFYRGATYFRFARPLQRAYLAYESLVERRQARNLATHYLVVARR